MLRIQKLVLVLIAFISIGELVHSRRLTFKESLTSYAENEDQDEATLNPYKVKIITNPISRKNFEENEHERIKKESEPVLRSGSGTLKSEKNGNVVPKPKFSRQTTTVFVGGNNNSNGLIASGKETTGKSFSLWEITKNMLLSFQQKGGKRFITGNGVGEVPQSAQNNSRSVNSANESAATGTSSSDSCCSPSGRVSRIPTKEMPKQQAWDNFLTTMKNERGGKMGNSYDNKNNTAKYNALNTTKLHLKDLEEEYNRKKKEVGNNAGLRDLMWNTARALWSVNKEHFLPTFLHTKTGGKLSLIRDSIFKPITILSQFKTGVQEINNEKWRNLARLTSSAGSGWSRPSSEVVVVKLQPQNSQLLTLVRYIIRLSKHTVITKWKLKRALLDLQFRALKKLIRIISNKNLGQKIATIKILTNAAVNGKIAFFRIVTNALDRYNNNKTGSYYSGKDNSINVDLTYSSLNNNNYKNNGWLNSSPTSTYYKPTPPPPPAPVYSPPQDSYHPLSPPPSPAIHTNYYHNPENTPSLPLLPPPLSLSYGSPPPEHLIETPSYAGLLKIMGINPSNYDYKYEASSSTTAKVPASTSILYSSFTTTTSSPIYSYQQTFSSNGYHHKRPLIEKPAASYSYHFSKPENDYNSYNLVSAADSSSAFTSSLFSPNKIHSNNSSDVSNNGDNDENDIITASASFPSSPSSMQQFLTSSKTSTVNNKVATITTSTTTPSPFRLKLLKSMGASAIS